MYYFNLSESKSGLGKSLFEYLFFFISNEVLYTSCHYDESYIYYLKEKFKIDARFQDVANYVDFNNFFFNEKPEWEYLLSSKIEFTNFCLNNNLYDHEVRVLKSNHGTKSGFIYKDEFGFSGRGIHNESQKSYPQIEEEKLDRFLDFSLYFFSEDKIIIYENEIDQFYQYKGSKFCKTNVYSIFDFLSPYLKPQKIEKFLRGVKIINSQINTSFSLDSFIYKKNGENCVHPGCEVNIRKTMGSIFYEIWKSYFSDQVEIRFKIEKVRNTGQSLSPENQSFFINYQF